MSKMISIHNKISVLIKKNKKIKLKKERKMPIPPDIDTGNS